MSCRKKTIEHEIDDIFFSNSQTSHSERLEEKRRRLGWNCFGWLNNDCASRVKWAREQNFIFNHPQKNQIIIQLVITICLWFCDNSMDDENG